MTRGAADIGQGLAEARRARRIIPGERIHVVGAGGAAASAAAILADAAGASVSACDAAGPSPYDVALATIGVGVIEGHDPAHVDGAAGPLVDRVAVTKALTAVRPDHPELDAARAAGISLEPVQQLIADAAASLGRRLIGVTGTHGKSTTTGWVLHQLVAAGRDPSGFVGALLPPALTGLSVSSTARVGHGPEVVVEADEYAGNFDPYRPAIGAVTTVEWDHPDVFATEDAVLDAVEGWIRRFEGLDGPPVLVANVGDRGVRRLVERLTDWPGRLLTVRLVLPDEPADVDQTPASGTLDGRTIVARVTAEDQTGMDLAISGLATGETAARVGLVGRHVAADGLVAIGVALEVGVDPATAVAGLASFRGIGRRLEQKGDVGDIVVLDDYGHHPTAIAATIAAVRQGHPGRPLWAVYEPLTFHRTAAMLDAFAGVLATAEHVAIVDIWASRDPDMSVVAASDLAAAIQARGTEALATGSPEESAGRLAGLVRPGDVVLVMGGGRSYVVAERLVALLTAAATD
jgi:UDP-N-acetylmuramate--alanine ligase